MVLEDDKCYGKKNHQGKWGPECGSKRGYAVLLNRVVLVGLTEEILRRLRQRVEGGEGVSLEETGKSIHGRGNGCKVSVCVHRNALT